MGLQAPTFSWRPFGPIDFETLKLDIQEYDFPPPPPPGRVMVLGLFDIQTH